MEWYNLSRARSNFRAFNVIIGGRGIGKTYSALDFLISEEQPFIYMRNTDVQLKESASEFGNPFKKWSTDHGRDVKLVKEGMHAAIIEGEKRLGHGVALSTFENMRGVDLSDVRYVLFDEFIEKRKLAFDQFNTFTNFYETVNRNRELLGEPPLMVFMLSNAQKLGNPILAGLGLIPVIENMLIKGSSEYKAGNFFIDLPESAVSEAKRNTALYGLTKDTFFYKEALDNKFAYDSFRGIYNRKLREYYPVVGIDDLYIYKHKSTGRYYICYSQSNTCKTFTSKDNKALFMRFYGIILRDAEASDRVEYSDFTAKMKLQEILGI